MTELKTLKDMQGWVDGKDQLEVADVKDLKQEAIKWIKDIHKEISAREFIRTFFNITEEDLK